MVRYWDAFISYGRADSKDFARSLTERLLQEGFDAWFDFEDIPAGVDYQNQINDGIEKAHNFLFVISPHAVNSPYCTKEVELALALGKRIIPLLHVESLDYETWRQRYPQGTDEAWRQYQADGLHTSFTHMHPEIARINWIYFREGLDDFEAALQTLQEVLRRQQDYVQLHTRWLAESHRWEQHQRQAVYLLTGKALQEGMAWLHHYFRDEQPPCLPTHRQCEFITESQKWADQGLTQIFLSYSEEDRVVQQALRQQLMRAGFTVWINRTDIHSGEDFVAAIRQGIEGSDRILLLLSPAALASEYCRQELIYARSYAKPIIPLLVTEMDLALLPEDLRTLQFIDFSHQTDQPDAEALARLVRALREDTAYYDRHKRLLVQALAWDRMNRPKTMVLRGHEFAIAEAWLLDSTPELKQIPPTLQLSGAKFGLPSLSTQSRRRRPPTQLHRDYIDACREMNKFFDAFISYGRADSKNFAIQLHQRLTDQGLRVWFDQNDIPLGVNFQNEINDGIEKAHNFIFIISPHSANSTYCLREVEHALAHNKRIIPLLHVEAIGYQTWKQRYPSGSPDEWRAYKTKGKHASEPNLHPALKALNWIWCREDQDNLEVALQGLLDLMGRHEAYVTHHTELLARALLWEQQKRLSQLLLVGEERQAAAAWLRTTFPDEQPPCLPTDLHCEFITESMQNADNLMTRVFLAHAEADNVICDRIRRSLMRAGITVWASHMDIKGGADFQQEINQGIEQADNLLYLISPQALNSQYCQQEVAYARQHHKRLIPVMVEPTPLETIPPEQLALQFIVLTDHSPEAYQAGLDQVLAQLEEDGTYYAIHKRVLVQALKWDRQHRNTSILLRGHNLRQAAAWLTIAQRRSQQGPTDLQTAFIQASQEQPADAALEVFISYSRSDSDFARRLNETLQLHGKTTWFDQESIAAGSDFQQEIYRGIETCHNVVFVISPNAINSSYCVDEVKYALGLNKRLITLLHRPVNVVSLPPELAAVQWIDFNGHGGDFIANFSELVRALDTDRDHVQGHTKWHQRALDWDTHGRSEDLLLRGRELAIAEAWLTTADEQAKSPPPTDRHRAYLQASIQLRQRQQQEREDRQRQEIRRARRIAIGTTAAGMTMAGLALFAAVKLRTAEIERTQALRATAEVNLASGQGLDALTSSLQAARTLTQSLMLRLWPYPSLRGEVSSTLQKMVDAGQERNRFTADLARLSPDGQWIATADADGQLSLWQVETRQQVRWPGHDGPVLSLSFSPDSRWLLSSGEDGRVVRWDLTGQVAMEQALETPINSARFSADGMLIVTGDDTGWIRLWSLDGQSVRAFPAHQDYIDQVAISPNGTRLASHALDGSVTLWDSQGKALKTAQQPPDERILDLTFSPDSQRLVMGNTQGELQIWDPQGQALTSLQAHRGGISSIQFAPDGQGFATASWDGAAKLWDLNGILQAELRGHKGELRYLRFSPDGQMIATGGDDGTVRLWTHQGIPLVVLQGHRDGVYSLDWGPENQTLVTSSWDHTARFWDLRGQQQTTLAGHTDGVDSVQFSSDGTQLLTVSWDGTARLWDTAGQAVAQLQEASGAILQAGFQPDGQSLFTKSDGGQVHLWSMAGKPIAQLAAAGPVFGVWPSPDGTHLATTTDTGQVEVWDWQGNAIATLPPPSSLVQAVSFSPDGQTLATANETGQVALWTLAGGSVAQFAGDDAPIYQMQFAPDGQSLVTASEQRVRQWSLTGTLQAEQALGRGRVLALGEAMGATRAAGLAAPTAIPHIALVEPDGTVILQDFKQSPPMRLEGHTAQVTRVHFTSDDRWLITVAEDGTARLWQTNGTPVAVLGAGGHQHASQVLDAAINPAGTLLASSGADGTVKLWPVEDLPALMDRSCVWLEDYLQALPDTDATRHLCEGVRR